MLLSTYQLVVGRLAVAFVSVFVRPRAARVCGGKKEGFGVTCADISETYHLLQQINMASECLYWELYWIFPTDKFTCTQPLNFCYETYFLVSSTLATGSTHPNGMGFYLGLSALNFAEADRPVRLLTKQQLSEMYFTLGLQCHFSIPYGATLPMVCLVAGGNGLGRGTISAGFTLPSFLYPLSPNSVVLLLLRS